MSSKGSEYEFMFDGLLKKRVSAPYEREYKFCDWRKFKFDFAFPAIKIAIEIDGCVFQGGRHNRPMGFMRDCEKFNIAGALGWTIFRIPAPWFAAASFHKIEYVIDHIVKVVAKSDVGF